MPTGYTLGGSQRAAGGLSQVALPARAGLPPAHRQSAHRQSVCYRYAAIMSPWPTLPDFTHYPLTDGGQFWTDWLWRRGYRLQSCAVQPRWRVVDPEGRGRLVGSRQQAEAELDRLAGPAGDWDDADSPAHIAILLHGLMRTRRCMKRMEQNLLAPAAGVAGPAAGTADPTAGSADRWPRVDAVARVDYASTRQSVAEAAAGLVSLVEGMPRRSRLSFVGHSMGNIVLRYALGSWQVGGDRRGVLGRMHRVVMLGPPNHGAAIARLLAKTKLFGWVVGGGGLSLGPAWDRIESHLGTPPCRFAIVAGDLSPYRIVNPLVAPRSDLVVSVDEAKLPGADPFLTIPVAHSTMMTSRRVIAFTVGYLNDQATAPAAVSK